MTEQLQDAPKRRLDALDYLRFMAASMVLCYHYLFFGVVDGDINVAQTPLVAVAKYCYLGVDLFFLISGFVIMDSARGKSASAFAVSRATRLLPAFWIAMLLTTGAIALWGDRVGLSVSAPQVAVNGTMVPGLLGVPAVDGVYWTLQFEIEFYAAVFALLLLRQGGRIGVLMPLWSVGMLVVTLVAPGFSHYPYLGGYFAYFVIGAIISEIRWDGRATPLRVIGLAAGLAVMIPWSHHIADTVAQAEHTDMSHVVVSVVVLLWVAVIASFLIPRVSGTSLPQARLAGGITYPLYLLHANLGYIAMSFWISDRNRWVAYPLTAAGALVLAALVHLVERHPLWGLGFRATIGRAVAAVERRTASPAVPSVVGSTVTRLSTVDGFRSNGADD